MTNSLGVATPVGVLTRHSATSRWRCGRAGNELLRWAALAPEAVAAVGALSESLRYVAEQGRGCVLTWSLIHRNPICSRTIG
jgi:hypothetical protein